MREIPPLPGAYTVNEMAAFYGCSRSEMFRRIHSGAGGLQVVRVGNSIMVLNRGLAEAIARTLPIGDARRDIQDEADRVIAEQLAEQRALAAKPVDREKQQKQLERQQAEISKRYRPAVAPSDHLVEATGPRATHDSTRAFPRVKG